MYVCTRMSMYMHFLHPLIQLGRKKKRPFAQSMAVVCRQNEGKEPEQQSLVSSAIMQTTNRYNCFPASQILLGLRKQDQEMLRLRRKLGTYYLSFCLRYSANIRKGGMKETTRLLLCGSVLMCTLTKTRWGLLGRRKDKGRIFNNYSSSG